LVNEIKQGHDKYIVDCVFAYRKVQ